VVDMLDETIQINRSSPQKISAIFFKQNFLQYLRLNSQLMDNGLSNVAITIGHFIAEFFHLSRSIF
jgi:hypothetical protein